MDNNFIGVRDVNKEVFRKLKLLALSKGLNIGEVLTMAMNKFIEDQKHQSTEESLSNIKRAFGFKSLDFGKGSEKLSLEMDEFLYRTK